MRSGADIWVCGRCRSVNPLSRSRCYRCSTPIEIAAARPEDLSVAHQEQAPEPTGEFRSSETYAVAVTVGAVAFIFATLLALWTNWSATQLRDGGDPVAAAQLVSDRLPMLLLAPVTAFLALVAFGAWIRRIVENLPALGAGYSRVSPTWAFFEPLIPGFNVYAIPTRMAEAITKLGGHPSAMPLLGLAIVFAFGPAVVVAFLLRFTRLFGTGAELREAIAIGLIVVFVAQAIAIAIGLVVVWQIEGMCRAKHETLAAAGNASEGTTASPR